MEASPQTINRVQQAAVKSLGIPIEQIQAMGPGELKNFLNKLRIDRFNELSLLDKLAHRIHKS